MIFSYKAVDQKGEDRIGTIDTLNQDLAIKSLQRRGLIVLSIEGEEEDKKLFQKIIFERVTIKDIVIFSRQISTLFEAEISAVKAFKLLAGSTENKTLRNILNQVVEDLQAGSSIHGALAKHPNVFSNFYVNMIKAGEESGQLNESFIFLADYLDRQYYLISRTRNALIYPAFVIMTFIVVMILLFVMVIPRLSQVIIDSGQTVPVYTRVVISISQFFVNYGIFLLIAVILGGIYLWVLSRRNAGKKYLDKIKLEIPIIGGLYKKLYLSRIADNLNTMLSSGISIIRAIEITGDVVGNRVYEDIMKETREDVKSGSQLSVSFSKHKEISSIMIQMIQVGEETGSLGSILKTLGKFYQREVDDSVNTLVGLIEPIMVVVLGLGVGILLTSVLLPIYNIAGSIS